MPSPVRCLALLISLTILGGCQKSREPAMVVTAGYLPMVSSLTYFVADENGYFVDEGLRIDARPIKTSNAIAQDLAAGNLDVAIELSIVPLLKMLGSSEPKFRIFSTSRITAENGFDGVLVLPSSPVTDLGQLSGRRVGVFPGTTAKNTFARVFGESFPGSPMPIFIEVDPALHLPSLSSGDIDAVHAYEPMLSVGIVDFGYRKVYASIYSKQLSPNPIGVAAVNAEWAEANPAAVNAVLRALDRAVRFIDSNPAEARAILAKRTASTARLASQMNIMPMSPSEEVDRANLQAYLDILYQLGESAQRVQATELLLVR
jgi:ABC-type nitrate/sulfonate/bicarbonate transport system substrate-binding protein